MYGLPPDDDDLAGFADDFEPILQVGCGARGAVCWAALTGRGRKWLARPTLVEAMAPGSTVGYMRAYRIGGPHDEHIAVLPLGYAGMLINYWWWVAGWRP